MQKEEIIRKLNDLFKQVLNNNDININEETKMSDIDDWDSLNHATLIASIEEQFNVKFELIEIMNFKNLKNIISSLEKKIAE
jgi:acyl carrier protein